MRGGDVVPGDAKRPHATTFSTAFKIIEAYREI
jgi:hypothetical protein